MNGRRSSAALAAALVLLAGGCTGPRAPATSHRAAASPAAPTALPAPEATGLPIGVSANRVGRRYVNLTKQKRNHVVYVLRADAEKGHYFGQDTGSSVFLNPHITFYAPDRKRLIADAPTGTVVEKDKTVLMSGGVHARTETGLTLRSDTLRYNDETDLVHGAGNVVVTSPQGEELQGETLDWNLRDGSIDVSGSH